MKHKIVRKVTTSTLMIKEVEAKDISEAKLKVLAGEGKTLSESVLPSEIRAFTESEYSEYRKSVGL